MGLKKKSTSYINSDQAKLLERIHQRLDPNTGKAAFKPSELIDKSDADRALVPNRAYQLCKSGIQRGLWKVSIERDACSDVTTYFFKPLIKIIHLEG